MTTTLTTATTQTSFPNKLLHMPPNDVSLMELKARIDQKRDTQQTAATATTYFISTHAGRLLHVRLGVSVAPGSGESMVFDVQKNGTSVLKATVTINSTTAKGYFDLTGSIVAGTYVNPGDVFSVIRTYTSGTPNAPVTEVTVEWG